MTTNVAKQYAIALFSLASKKKITDDIFTDFKQLLSGFNDLVWRFFLNPRIEDDDKKNLFGKTKESKINDNLFRIKNRGLLLKPFDLIKVIFFIEN